MDKIIDAETPQPEVTIYGPLSCQVCVPNNWTDDQIIIFANSQYPCGTENGWKIAKEGERALAGFHERVRCSSRNGFVHVILLA